MKTKTLFYTFAIAMLFSCQNTTSKDVESNNSSEAGFVETEVVYSSEGDTISHAKLTYFDFDKIEDLNSFFCDLSISHPIVKWAGEEDRIEEQIANCINRIDAYRKGCLSYYPASLVKDCISHMGFNIAACNNHSENADLVLAEWVIMCAAFYSPDITCLVETQTPDHQAGFYNLGKSYNFAPWWPYLFVKKEKGYEVISLGDYKKVCSIFELLDDKNQKYYLCSNNQTMTEFCQWLFYIDENESYIKVAECDFAPQKESSEYFSYYFDRKNLVWRSAYEDSRTGKLIATEYDPAMRLILDGVKSRFE